MKKTKTKIDKSKPHYRIVHFYKRDFERATTLPAALAILEQRRLNCPMVCYSQIWEMSNETVGTIVAFFEDGAPAKLIY